jgi:hypothetical protein
MVHHLVLCKLKAGIGDEQVERIMRGTRSQLLKIPEVRAIHCGKRIVESNEWGFFFAADYESMDKMSEGHSDPVYLRFIDEVIAPHVSEQLALSYEMDPDKDVRYS